MMRTKFLEDQFRQDDDAERFRGDDPRRRRDGVSGMISSIGFMGARKGDGTNIDDRRSRENPDKWGRDIASLDIGRIRQFLDPRLALGRVG
jgi:hypothetical protein